MNDTRDGSQLCTACGLCCQGMFHSYANVTEREIVTLEANGFVILSGTRGPAFSLPCTRLENNHCSIYPERPEACRSYRCHLLNRYLAGEIDLEQGLEIVGKVKNLGARILSKIGSGAPGESLWRRIQAQGAEQILFDGTDPETCLDIVSLLALISRHFDSRVKPGRVSPS